MTDLAKLVVRLEAQTAQYMAGMDAANKKLDRFTSKANVSAKNIARGVAAAGLAVATAFGAMTKSAIDHGDQLDELAQQTGISVESLSRMEYAAKFSGIALEDLAKAQGKLSKQMVAAAEGNKNAVQAFQQIGVAVKNADGTLRDSEQVILDVAEVFSKMEDGAGKTAIAMELFGKAGASMIPFLNEGRAGIEKLNNEADALGVTMSTKAAKQAAEFNDQLDRMKGISAGLGNQLAAEMLPTMSYIAKAFMDSAKNGEGLNAVVGVMAVTFKTLLTAATVVVSVFQQIGRVIYGVGEAIVRLGQMEFKMAGQAITDTFDELKRNNAGTAEFIAGIWGEGLEEIEVTAKKIGDSIIKNTIIFNPSKAKEEAEKVAKAALDSLKDMAAGLQEQAAVYGMTEQAAIRYRVAQGDIAIMLDKAGKAGETYISTIISQTDRLEELKAAEEKATKSKEAMNDMMEKGKSITESVQTPLETYVKTLNELAMLQASGAISLDTMFRASDKAKKELDDSTKVVNKWFEEMTENAQDILGDGIYDVMTGGMEDGVKGMLKSFEEMLFRMVAQSIAADIGGKLFGTGGVGSGGGWLDSLMGFGEKLFGGSMDTGGRGTPGTAYLIGKGAQPEMFVPDRPGKFIPNADDLFGGSHVTQNIYVTGQVDQRTGRQLAMETTRRQRQAARLS